MKICWDNLEGVYLSKDGNFRKGRTTYYEDVCKECGEVCLVKSNSKGFCNQTCSNKYNYKNGILNNSKENNHFWKGGIKVNNYQLYNLTWVNKYRARKLNQTPDDANQEIIQWYYDICQQKNKQVGKIAYHVDHIIPLSKGGFHHEDNLQILTATQNMSKSNYYKN